MKITSFFILTLSFVFSLTALAGGHGGTGSNSTPKTKLVAAKEGGTTIHSSGAGAGGT